RGRARAPSCSKDRARDCMARKPAILGKRALLNGSEYTVAGLMPADFQVPQPAFKVWAPWKLSANDLANRNLHWYTLIARLRPGVTQESAQARLQGFSWRSPLSF